MPAAQDLSGRFAYDVNGDIWVMNADGSDPRQLTRSGPGTDFDPSWSADGTEIVFRTSRGEYAPDERGTGTEGIFVVSVGSGDEDRVTATSRSG